MSELRLAFDPVADALEDLGVAYRVGSSVASAALGVARTTLDIDIVADISNEHVDRFVARLHGDYYVDAESIREAIARRRSFNLIHFATMVKVDVFVRVAGGYDDAAFGRSTASPIADRGDRLFPMSTPEDIVLRKLLWYEKGGRSSERQWNDVLGVLRVQRGSLDLEYMRHWGTEIGVRELLEAALLEARPES